MTTGRPVRDSPPCHEAGCDDDQPHMHVRRGNVTYKRRLAPIRHGERAGYVAHVKRRLMPACEPCTEAASVYMADLRAEARAAPAPLPPGRRRPPPADPALAILAHRHATELQAIRLALATRVR